MQLQWMALSPTLHSAWYIPSVTGKFALPKFFSPSDLILFSPKFKELYPSSDIMHGIYNWTQVSLHFLILLPPFKELFPSSDIPWFRVTWAVLPWSIALLAWLPNFYSIVHIKVRSCHLAKIYLDFQATANKCPEL